LTSEGPDEDDPEPQAMTIGTRAAASLEYHGLRGFYDGIARATGEHRGHRCRGVHEFFLLCFSVFLALCLSVA
jgi:hypothetical protein